MLEILKYEVHGLENAMIASGLPMSTNDELVYKDFEEDDLKRSKNLGKAKSGSGHDCYLKGIKVIFFVKFPEYWSPQFQRYHFADIISSQSKMHRITKMGLNKDNCNEYVDTINMNQINKYINNFNFEIDDDPEYIEMQSQKREWFTPKYYWFMKIISNLPMGFEKIMAVETNYLQLKSIYNQRKSHKLKEDWGAFCDWIVSLPKFKELTGI